MTNTLAAYDFGYRVVALIRHTVEFVTPPVDPSGEALLVAAQIRAAIVELEEALTVVAPEIDGGGVQAVQLTLQRLLEYADSFADVGRDFAGHDQQILGRFVDLPFFAAWRTLTSVAEAVTRRYPRVYCWYELGATLAQLGSRAGELRHSPAATELPDLEPLIRAVEALPQSFVRRVAPLARLLQETSNRAWRDRHPIDLLTPVITWKGVGKKADSPATTLLLMLLQMSWQIREALINTPESRHFSLRTTGPGEFHAVLDGVPHPLTEAQHCILKSLLAANGQFKTRQAIKEEHGSLLMSVKIENEVKALRVPLRRLIESKQSRRGGYMLNLDE